MRAVLSTLSPRLALAACLLLAAPWARADSPIESYDSGWTLYLDNDNSGASNDQNYTGGMAILLAGERARRWPVSLDPLLGAVNRGLHLPRWRPAVEGHRSHALEFGLAAFTPDDLKRSDPIPGDHPYACLAYLSNARQDVFAAAERSYQSTLMLGLLGTDLCKSAQRSVHKAIDATRPRGWDNQISEGGEPTALWTLNRHQPLHEGRWGALDVQIIGNLEAALGLSTHMGAGLSLRVGRLRSPWWSFAPHQSEYVGFGSSYAGGGASDSARDEWYLWSGVMLRERFYNGLLQGQFRDSAVSYDRDELRSTAALFSTGIAADFSEHYSWAAALHAKTREIRSPLADPPIWAEIIFRYQP